MTHRILTAFSKTSFKLLAFTRVLYRHWTYDCRGEHWCQEGMVSGLHHLREEPGNRDEPMCVSPQPGLISGLRGTSYHGNLWIPKAFPAHDSVSALSTESSSPWKATFWFVLGVPTRGQLYTGLLGLSLQGWPLRCVSLTLGNKTQEEGGSTQHQSLSWPTAFLVMKSGRPQWWWLFHWGPVWFCIDFKQIF